MAKFSSKFTSIRQSTDRSPRSTGIKRLVLHHAATTNLDGLVAMMMPGGREVSAHGAVKDSKAVGVVPEEWRAWSLGSAVGDSEALTLECCNSAIGGNWPLSPATHEMIAQIAADWCRRYGIKPNRSGNPKTWTIIGHREDYTIYGRGYATACPGGMDLYWIARRVLQILGDSNVAVPPITTGSGPAAPAATHNGYAIRTIQERVNAAGYTPKLDVDNVYGPKTIAGVKWLQRKVGAKVDGDYGPETDRLYLAWRAGPKPPATTPKPGSKKLLVDGEFGPASVTRLQQELAEEGHKPGAIDGIWGKSTAKALQRKLKVRVDGDFGLASTRALQGYLRVKVDGRWGPITTRALQTRLNADTF